MSKYTKRFALSLTAAAFTAAALAVTAVPASAAVGDPNTLTLFAGPNFLNPTAIYNASALGTKCHKLSTPATAEWNNTEIGLYFFTTTNCTGIKDTVPKEDIGNLGYDMLSFRTS
jgi:hypothetical protein